ncbi:MAG: methyltransferase domain-containing protein [Betaproteobacteria bacterium]
MPHDRESPSDWVSRFAPLIAPAGRVLDLACGHGRHTRLLAGLGFSVTAVDRDEQALASIYEIAGEVMQADLESGAWPFERQLFAGVIVSNYLHRPLLPRLVQALLPGGVLIYETFAVGNERYGRPANPKFLLEPGELLRLAYGHLRIVAYEDLYSDRPRPAMVQRICAVNGGAASW